MPGFNLGSRISLDGFQSRLFPADDNRLLEPTVVLRAKALLLSGQAHALAAHVTREDLRVLRAAPEEDLGVGVTSGLELCTLPQGEQLRDDIIERSECQRLWVMTSLMTCQAVGERARMLSQWIQIAGELRSSMGNMFAFASIVEGLTSPQVARLRDTWLTLRQQRTASAFLFDTKLKALLRNLRDGSAILPVQRVALPNLAPFAHLLHRQPPGDSDSNSNTSSSSGGGGGGGCGGEDDGGSSDERALIWEAGGPCWGLDFLLPHLDIARIVATYAPTYRDTASALLQELGAEGEEGEEERDVKEVCRTEFQLRVMWGSKGARAAREERCDKLGQLLTVLSERLEPPGDDGTEV